MRWMWLLFVLSMIAAGQAELPARVEGRTVGPKGDALAHSTVTLLGAKTYSQTSDEHGAFRFDGVAPGKYALLAARRGYYTQKYGGSEPLNKYCATADISEEDGLTSEGLSSRKECIANAPGGQISLAAGQEMVGLAIRLLPLAMITGRVLDPDGEGVANWRVQALQVSYQRGQRQLSPQGFGSATDTQGNFSLNALAPGRYYLYALNSRANLFGGLNNERAGKPEPEVLLPTYYPAVADDAHATPVDVVAGADLSDLEIHVRRSKVYTIRGRVAAPENFDVKTQMLQLDSKAGLRNWQSSRSQKVNADGTFEFQGVEPGAWTIRGGQAFANPGLPPPLFGQTEVTVATANVDGVVINMVRGIELSGTIRIEGDKLAEWPTIILQSVDSQNGGQVQGIDAQGRFHFQRPIAPAKFLYWKPRLQGAYVESVTCGRQDALHFPLDLSGGSCGSFDIVLSRKVGTLTGKVVNERGEAAGGIVVSVWPKKAEVTNAVRTGATDQNGRFEIHDLGPGDYLAVALEEIDPALADVPEFLSHLPTAAASLDKGGHTEVELKVISKERIAAETARLR